MKWGGELVSKEKRAFCIENGICTRCGKEMAAKNHTQCLSCLDYNKIIYERRKAKKQLWYQQNNAEMRAKHKETYQYRRSKGLCVTCGLKTKDGMSRCERCRLKHNAKQRRLYNERKCGGQSG